MCSFGYEVCPLCMHTCEASSWWGAVVCEKLLGVLNTSSAAPACVSCFWSLPTSSCSCCV